MTRLLCGPGGERLFESPERSELLPFSANTDLSQPAIFAWSKKYTMRTRSVVAPEAHVHAVHALVCEPKIFRPIVRPIAVDMIENPLRPLAMGQPPNKAMGAHIHVSDAKRDVPMALATSLSSSKFCADHVVDAATRTNTTRPRLMSKNPRDRIVAKTGGPKPFVQFLGGHAASAQKPSGSGMPRSAAIRAST